MNNLIFVITIRMSVILCLCRKTIQFFNRVCSIALLPSLLVTLTLYLVNDKHLFILCHPINLPTVIGIDGFFKRIVAGEERLNGNPTGTIKLTIETSILIKEQHVMVETILTRSIIVIILIASVNLLPLIGSRELGKLLDFLLLCQRTLEDSITKAYPGNSASVTSITEMNIIITIPTFYSRNGQSNFPLVNQPIGGEA